MNLNMEEKFDLKQIHTHTHAYIYMQVKLVYRNLIKF
jgi:hypothetical protein